jgi:hypothetical protein
MIAPTILLWAAGVLLVVLITLHLEGKKGNGYTFVDVLKNPVTGKADLNAHIVLWLALMCVWVIIDRSNDGKDVDTLVATVLGVFVLGRVAGKGIDAWKDKPPGGTP